MQTPNSDYVLLGRGGRILLESFDILRRHADAHLHIRSPRLSFMTDGHHRVRDFVVTELPRVGRAIPSQRVAEGTGIALESVEEILDELERQRFFLVRDRDRRVSWAFPVTSEKTPHLLRLSTGEEIHAAWAEDAVPAPFVQGCLRNEPIGGTIRTRCALTGRRLTLVVSAEGDVEVREKDASPLLFEPEIDWTRFTKPNILDDFWRNSVFFWSEEEARAHRREKSPIDGIYLTMAQASYVTRVGQASLFDIDLATGRPRRC